MPENVEASQSPPDCATNDDAEPRHSNAAARAYICWHWGLTLRYLNPKNNGTEPPPCRSGVSVGAVVTVETVWKSRLRLTRITLTARMIILRTTTPRTPKMMEKQLTNTTPLHRSIPHDREFQMVII